MFKLPGRVLIQRPDGTFAATEDRSGVVNRRYEITSLVADFNQDGYPDMVRVNPDGPAVAFINQGGDRHYLKVRLPDNASTMCAWVTVTTASGKKLHDWLVTGEGLVCDQSHVLTFALGEETECTRIDILYPDDRTQSIQSPPVDTLAEIDATQANDSPDISIPGDV